ncbi:MAG: hypothetical protein KHZ79_07255 [Atopobium minutum]|uniref:hypothetical protein n=1 Tax=Atopobium minutum TaxID=1381 RepID=UPI001D4C10ED|nr:hypothetical protein [Atopobium minutum]MBS4874154.1 hypothetical protein [Atopobium minutum]
MSIAAQVLSSINNYFETLPTQGVYQVLRGEILPVAVAGSASVMPKLEQSQYYLVAGSALNDGLHEMGQNDLLDEGMFEGTITPCAVPKELRDLFMEIEQWQAKNGNHSGAMQSESFDGYSYSLATDAVTGGAVTWQTVFRSRLNRWRKL